MKKMPMKMVEYQHRNEGGGNMVQLPNEIFDHGESVLIVSKQEFERLLRQVGIDAGLDGRPNHAALNKRLMDLLSEVASL